MIGETETPPWGVTQCPDCDDWTAELQDTRAAQIAHPTGDGIMDVIAYAAQCYCGGTVFRTVQLAWA